MDGVHDMGGMHGFGPVDSNDDGAPFPETWQSRVFAMNLALSAAGDNVDRFRFLIEAMAPADYLAASYYERWLASMMASIAEHQLLDDAEIEEITAGREPDTGAADSRSLAPDITEVMANAPTGYTRDMSGQAGFAVGDRVRARTFHRAGHTRLPRYARGCCGEVVSDNGNQHLPDAHADTGEIVMQRLYTVRFCARTLWGATANAKDSICLDLWESYLEPA